MSHQANMGEIKGCQVSVAFFLTFTLSKKASPVVIQIDRETNGLTNGFQHASLTQPDWETNPL